MLVISRKADQRIAIGPDVTVTICKVEGSRVLVGVEAPAYVHVLRAERLGQGRAAAGARTAPPAPPAASAPPDSSRARQEADEKSCGL